MVTELLQSVLGLDEVRCVQVRSLAISHNRKTQMATANFQTTPLCLSSGGDEWSFDISDFNPSSDISDDEYVIHRAPKIIVDTHFRGLTILRSFKKSSKHKIE